MMQLRPIENRPEYSDTIEKALINFWIDVFYRPIMDIIKKPLKEISNDSNLISEALRSGDIQYSDGAFQGKFNSKLIKEFIKIGAKRDKRTGFYNINIHDIPFSIQSSIVVAQARIEGMHKAIVSHLDGLSDAVINQKLKQINLSDDYKNLVSSLESQFQKSVKSITVKPELTDDMADNIATDYSKNMDKYIKGWTEENILRLREKVNENFMAGFRSDRLIKIIKSNYNVSESKAKFLAKQETSLLTAKFREQRYKESSVNRYRWKIKGFNTRPDHEDLDGKIFYWDNPPVTNKKTGARNNPGEDFGCNCIAIAIVDF